MNFFSGIMRIKKPIAVVLAIVGIFFLADFIIGQKQDAIIRERNAKKQRLEKLAFQMVFPDVSDAWDIPGSPEKYEAVLKIENLADEPVYATYPEVTAYVQTGTYWTEVPIHDKQTEKREQVAKLEKGEHFYRKIVTIKREIKHTFYQMYGYMHVRYHISMFVLPQSAFKEEEVIERVNDVYMYLKPYYMSDKEVLKQVSFPDNKVPTMIPMPPH
ncbi:MAG: hypothetical protein C0402_11070 [Thermodesulfovibrio sp.]|nr:hypothetical protein [Thermodesulfovibrio sp.]